MGRGGAGWDIGGVGWGTMSGMGYGGIGSDGMGCCAVRVRVGTQSLHMCWGRQRVQAAQGGVLVQG